MANRTYDALVRAGVPETLALRIEQSWEPGREPIARFLTRLGQQILNAAVEEFGAVQERVEAEVWR